MNWDTLGQVPAAMFDMTNNLETDKCTRSKVESQPPVFDKGIYTINAVVCQIVASNALFKFLISDSPTSHEEDVPSTCSKNKHLEDTMEAEAPEVKRLKFDEENEENEPVHSETSSEMPEESENTEKQEEAKDDPANVDKKGIVYSLRYMK